MTEIFKQLPKLIWPNKNYVANKIVLEVFNKYVSCVFVCVCVCVPKFYELDTDQA
jgi:hypothetical protein